jgi:2-methylcitrate dehydratase PrpD
MPKVVVTEDSDLSAAYPARWQARLRVMLASGETLDHVKPNRKGDPEDPLTCAGLFEKFDDLAGQVLDPEATRSLRRDIMSSGSVPGEVPTASSRHRAA